MEPVSLSIAEVREEIRKATGGTSGDTDPTSALLGRIFQQVCADLLGGDPELNWRAVLEPDSLSNRRKLLEHVYNRLLGPRLTEHQAIFQEHGDQALTLWKACQEMADWVGGVIEAAFRDRVIDFNRVAQQWVLDEKLVIADHPVTWTFRETHWTRPVVVSGILDAVWHNPLSRHWCLVDYKPAKTSPEADAGQVCLYHVMLAAGGFGPVGVMAFQSFLPHRHEQLYQPDKLSDAFKELRTLIGRMAGVLPEQTNEEMEFLLPEAPAKAEHEALGASLVKTLGQYDAKVELVGRPMVAPSYLRFTILPAKGVKVSSILSRSQELQVRLGLDYPPMIHKTSGKLVVDVQRPDRESVGFSSVRDQLPSPDDYRGTTKVLLGVDLFRRLQFADLKQTPHLLVAGMAGSGKTEWLRSAMAALICGNTPDTLRFVLIDPKRNAFGDLRGSPYLLDPGSLVYPPDRPATMVFDRLVDEMEFRYDLFAKHRVNDLSEYADLRSGRRPRIVCVCDEYADLAATKSERREVEERIRRLGAKARAVGIHLIIATEHVRPEIVDGALKANLAGRVCLRLTSAAQSNLVTGSGGAEKLQGLGDLLWSNIGEPVRLQAPLLTADEREKIFGWRAPALLEAAT